MCQDIYENDEFARVHIDKANDILSYDIKNIMFSGPEDVLKRTVHTQPAMFISSFVIGSILLSRGLKPACAAGHNGGLR